MANIELCIARLRRQRGISQQQLAERMGVAFQTVSKWETGATMPDIAMLPELAAYFQVSVDQLLGLQPLQGRSICLWNPALRGIGRDGRIICCALARPW